MEYGQRVSHLRNLARQYWFDLLVALLIIVAMLEVALGRGQPRGAPHTTLWFCLPAIAILALPIFARGASRSRVRRCTGWWWRGLRSSTRY